MDPATPDALRPVTAHPYLAFNVNPLIYIDPDGLASQWATEDEIPDGAKYWAMDRGNGVEYWSQDPSEYSDPSNFGVARRSASAFGATDHTMERGWFDRLARTASSTLDSVSNWASGETSLLSNEPRVAPNCGENVACDVIAHRSETKAQRVQESLTLAEDNARAVVRNNVDPQRIRTAVTSGSPTTVLLVVGDKATDVHPATRNLKDAMDVLGDPITSIADAGLGPNALSPRNVSVPTAGEGGVYQFEIDGRVKTGSTADFYQRYGGQRIVTEYPQTRFNKPEGVDDAAYRWTPRRQRRFDEEYIDRTVPSDRRYRSSIRPTSPVSDKKWRKFRQIFGYGDDESE